MNASVRNCGGTLESDRPMTPRLSFNRNESDVVRCPDSIFLRRSMKTNYNDPQTISELLRKQVTGLTFQ